MSDKTVIGVIINELLEATKIGQQELPPCLVQYSGNHAGRRFLLEESPTQIGRAVENQIVIEEFQVSRAHGRFTKNGLTWYYSDLGSSNGSKLNDQKLIPQTPYLIKELDQIECGGILFKFFGSQNIDRLIQDQIYQQATIDPGTGIYNKQYFIDALKSSFHYSKSSKQPLSLIYFDLDHFKKVNDSFGHNAGDQLLLAVATLVKSLIRKEDIFSRIGGEEFVIILPKAEIAMAAEMAERIRAGMELHEFALNKMGQKIIHHQTVSLGVTELTENITDPKELLEIADAKLYLSKTSGRNKVTQ